MCILFLTIKDAIPGNVFPFTLRITVGVELLRKMGWKEGQGIGPRIKRKPRRQKPGKGSEVPDLVSRERASVN